MTLHPIREDDDVEYDARPLAAVIQIKAPAVRVYLAGPMRGRVRFNFDAFEDATRELRALGYDVVSPAEHDLEQGFDPDLSLEEQGFDLREALLWDLEQVLTADAVVTLSGWQHSRGASAEVATAHAVGVLVVSLSEILDGAVVAA